MVVYFDARLLHYALLEHYAA